MATASTAVGAKLFRSTDSGSNYTETTGVYGITINGATVERLVATVLTDTSRTYIADLPDPQSISATVRFDGSATDHQALIADGDGGVTNTWKVEIPEPGVATVTTYVVDGFVQGFSPNLGINAVQDAPFTIQMQGAATVAHGQTAES